MKINPEKTKHMKIVSDVINTYTHTLENKEI